MKETRKLELMKETRQLELMKATRQLEELMKEAKQSKLKHYNVDFLEKKLRAVC